MNKRTLAAQLLHGGLAEQSRAVAQSWALPPQATGPELRAALITLPKRNITMAPEAAKRDRPLSPVAQVHHVTQQRAFLCRD